MGLFTGFKPYGFQGKIGMEKGLRNHRDRVAKVPAEHHAPRTWWKSAVQKHGQRFFHTAFHGMAEFMKHNPPHPSTIISP